MCYSPNQHHIRNASHKYRGEAFKNSSNGFKSCTVLHCTALHCSALPCTTLHCPALPCTTLLFSAVLFSSGATAEVTRSTAAAPTVSTTQSDRQDDDLSAGRRRPIGLDIYCDVVKETQLIFKCSKFKKKISLPD